MVYNNHIFTVEDGRLKVKGIYVGLPIEELTQVLLEQGFTVADNDSSATVYGGSIEGLGICCLSIREANNKVVSIIIRTVRKCTEDEALAVFEQVKSQRGFTKNTMGWI